MRILISADMEGAAGITDWIQVTAPESAQRASSTVEYERGRMLMTEEVNAAIDGAFAGGATEVLVTDAHGGKRNILPDLLDHRAELVSGSDNDLGMMQGIQEGTYAGVFFTGYHAKAGTPGAPLAHTSTGWIQDVRFDGQSVGEYGLNALLAGHFDVPVVLAAGDEKAVEQTQSLLSSDLIHVVTKHGYSSSAAQHRATQTARTDLREAAEQAIRDVGTRSPYKPRIESIQINVDHQRRADRISLLPGVTRKSARTISHDGGDPYAFCIIWRAILAAGGAA